MDDIRYTTSYRIKGTIASGGMGTVYQAEQLGANGFRKIIAIKTIRKSMMADKDNVALLVGEAKLVANLVHENILQVFQLGMRRGAFYIVMEYAHGRNLSDFISGHKRNGKYVNASIAAFIGSRIARALYHAHTATTFKGKPLGIVHRDINPSNVILTTQGVVKLADFGVAKAMTMKTPPENEVLMGKLPYLSPEMAHFEETTPRSDIFSLGLLLFELLTNRTVFEVDSLEMLNNLMDNYAIAPPSVVNTAVPPELDAIVMRALEIDPEKRYPDARVMCRELEKFIYGSGLGPTNEALATYIADMFGENAFVPKVRKGKHVKVKGKTGKRLSSDPV